MLTRDKLVELLQRERAYLAAEFEVSKIGLFGPYAKSQPDETSDIDIFVTAHTGAPWKRMAGTRDR